MAGTSNIEWTDKTWNPVRGCARVSPGCENCYAERVAARFGGPDQPYEGLVSYRSKVSGLRYTNPKAAGAWDRPRWAGSARFVPELLGAPLKWTKPARIFVNSMSDLFHEDVTNEQIAAVFGIMAACPQHTFQVLTKRPERMVAWFRWLDGSAAELPDLVGEKPGAGEHLQTAACVMQVIDPWLLPNRPQSGPHPGAARFRAAMKAQWPLPNLWLGVSVENQESAKRCWWLIDLPAAVRFVSVEPLLGPVDLTNIDFWRERTSEFEPIVTLDALRGHVRGPDDVHRTHVDWVIVGGESGPGARPFNVAWARSIVEQGRAAGVPVFVKQLGAHVLDRNDAGFDGGEGEWPAGTPMLDFNPIQGEPVRLLLDSRKGGDPNEWPLDLRVRQFPEARP